MNKSTPCLSPNDCFYNKFDISTTDRKQTYCVSQEILLLVVSVIMTSQPKSLFINSLSLSRTTVKLTFLLIFFIIIIKGIEI